jgi:hypothetical protein
VLERQDGVRSAASLATSSALNLRIWSRGEAILSFSRADFVRPTRLPDGPPQSKRVPPDLARARG